MAEGKEKIKNHVSAAKEWLGKAEQSLDEDNDIKGSLNLMLAQAELKRAQEKKKVNKKRYSSLLIHSMLVTSIAGIVLVVGFSGTSVFSPKTVSGPIVSAKIVPKAEQVKVEAIENNKEIPQRTEEFHTDVQKVEEEHPVLKIETSNKKTLEVNVAVSGIDSMPKKEEINVTPIEMQQLVRAAGKSLRGQN